MYYVRTTITYHCETYEDAAQIDGHLHREIQKFDENGRVFGSERKKMPELTVTRIDSSKFHKPDDVINASKSSNETQGEISE